MWDKILYISKWIAGVVGGITAIASIIIVIYSQGAKSEQKKIKDSSIEYKVDKLIVSDSLKNIKIDKVLLNQSDFSVKQSDMSGKLDNLNKSYINHLKTDKKVDELIQYLEGVKKNNEINLYQTVFVPKTLQIPLSLE